MNTQRSKQQLCWRPLFMGETETVAETQLATERDIQRYTETDTGRQTNRGRNMQTQNKDKDRTMDRQRQRQAGTQTHRYRD